MTMNKFTPEEFEDKFTFPFYSNGCYIIPIQTTTMKDGKISSVWMWVVSDTSEDIFCQGEPVEINLQSETEEGLVKKPEPIVEIEEEDYVHNDDDWK